MTLMTPISSVTPITPTQTASLLTGTLPVRAHADRFFGMVSFDGQQARVAGLVCDGGEVVALSLVGYETSVSAILAALWLRETVPFQIDEAIAWKGPSALKRRPESYKQFSTRLPGTRQSHVIALPLSAHIREGILHPPDLLPSDKKALLATPARPDDKNPPPPVAPKKDPRMRFVLGNWEEETPPMRSFLGHLYGMRVLFLHKDAEHPAWPVMWANELWTRGQTRRLIQPLPAALGMRAWRLSGDLDAWGRLIGEGVTNGWLPWTQTASLPLVGTALETAFAIAR